MQHGFGISTRLAIGANLDYLCWGPDHSPVELRVKRAYGIYRFRLDRTMPSSEWKPGPKGWPVTKRFGQLAYIDLAGLADYGAMEQAYNENV